MIAAPIPSGYKIRLTGFARASSKGYINFWLRCDAGMTNLEAFPSKPHISIRLRPPGLSDSPDSFPKLTDGRRIALFNSLDSVKASPEQL